MHLTTLVFGALLFCQIPPGQAPAVDVPTNVPADVTAEATPPVSPPTLYRLSPPEMVAEALVLPPGHSLEGRPLTLLTALSSAGDRTRQRNVVHAYWRLVETVAVYRFSFDYDKQLAELAGQADKLPQQADEAMLLAASRASSSALLREAELAVVAAQHALASLVLLPPDAPLPLPADRPHVGPYSTRFDQMFAMRAAPAAALLFDRTLPIERRAVDGRVSAVQAAEEALSAVEDAYSQGSSGPAAVLSLMKQRFEQRGAMITLVCRYNRDIADYALAVAEPGTKGQALVGMLIKLANDPLRPIVSPADGQVQPATLDEPIRKTRPQKNVPTLAPPLADEAKPIDKNVPTLAPPLDGATESSHKSVPPSAIRWRASEPLEKNVPTLAPPREEAVESSTEGEATPAAAPKAAPLPARPIVPIEPETEQPQSRTAKKQAAEEENHSQWRAAGGLYEGLADATPPGRAKQLTTALHWDRNLPPTANEPMSLAECLQACSPGNRAAAIDAFWLARQRAAEYQVLVQRVELLDGLPTAGSATDELRRQAAREAANPAVLEAHVALLEAQFELAGLITTIGDRPWPIPSTPPHSGSYVLNFDAQPRQLVDSWPLRRLAITIPGLHDNVLRHADAVVKADAARASAGNSLIAAIQRIDRQTEQTLAFLRALTDYNRAIAEYALTVLPPNTANKRLLAALVLQ
ncbi:MAG: hypothetical protein V3V75_09650 [Thermoguttaceae bacterium]